MSGEAAPKIAGPSDAPRVAPAALAAFVKRAFEAAGLPSTEAEIVAGLMVEADLRGSDTHGVIRLPLYLRRLKAGGINARPHIRIVEERPATALVDGDNGNGPPGHAVCRDDGDREGKNCRRCLGGRANEQPCRPGGALRHDAARP